MKCPWGTLWGKASVFYQNQLSPKLLKFCSASVGISKPCLKHPRVVISRVSLLTTSASECISRKIMLACACFIVYKSVSYLLLKFYSLQFTSGEMRIREVKGCAQNHNGKTRLKPRSIFYIHSIIVILYLFHYIISMCTQTIYTLLRYITYM